MTSAVVGQALTPCQHWRQSPKRATLDLLLLSSRTSVGHTDTQASQPVQRSSLMAWMSSLRLAFSRRFCWRRRTIAEAAAEIMTQTLHTPISDANTRRAIMAARHFKSNAAT